MTVGESLDWFLKIGMGWLGWTEQQTLDTSMPAIALAYEGRREMFNALFGGGESADAGPDEPAEPAADPDVGQKVLFALRTVGASLKSKGGSGR